MRSDKKVKDRPAAVLLICFLMMALVSVFAVKGAIDKIKNAATDTGGETSVTKSAEVTKKKSVEEETQSGANIVDSASSYTIPVKGVIITKFSMDVPIYWETLDQYMTHSGIDIASPAGTNVKACAAGTVTKIYEDDGLGVTVEINHGGDLISRYSNMTKKGLIELGEVVGKGDIIGQIGTSSIYEFDIDQHLHFEILKVGEAVDPTEYVE